MSRLVKMELGRGGEEHLVERSQTKLYTSIQNVCLAECWQVYLSKYVVHAVMSLAACNEKNEKYALSK